MTGTEWPEVSLGDHVDLLSGFAFKSKQFTDDPSDIPLVKGANVHQGFIDWETAKRWPSTDVNGCEKFFLKPDDVVLAMDRPWIDAGLKWAWIRPGHPTALLVQRVSRMRGLSDLDTRFLRYIIGSPQFTDYIRPIVTGVSVPHISGNQIKGFSFRLPPLIIQSKIAAILSAYDDLIGNNTRRIAILEEMAQAIYREWFVNFRFPGHENVRLVKSPLGEIPEGWECLTLGDCLSVLETGSRPKGGISEFSEGVVSIGAESIIGAGQFDFSRTRFIPPEYFENMKKGIVADRDVLVYKDGGKPGYFIPHISFFGNGFPYQTMALNSHVYRLRASDGVSQEFLYYHLSSEEMLHWMHLNGSGAAIPSIARKDLIRLPVILPKREVLELFTQITADNLSLILTVAKKNQVLRTTRDLLLPRLISGQLDVDDLDIDVGISDAELEEATA